MNVKLIFQIRPNLPTAESNLTIARGRACGTHAVPGRRELADHFELSAYLHDRFDGAVEVLAACGRR